MVGCVFGGYEKPVQLFHCGLQKVTETVTLCKGKKMNVKKWVALGVAGFFGLILFFGTVYTIQEGHIGVVKRFGKVVSSSDAGLHFKIIFVDSVEEIEVRVKKSSETLTASTSEQMPAKTKVSVNWTVKKESALDLYVKYGGLKQFEDRILDTRLRSASKNVISKFKAEQIIQNRQQVISQIEEALRKVMAKFPVTLDSVQLENITYPPKYMKSIETKQIEKNLADAERHKLARQKLLAQQSVNTAMAKRDSDKAIADGLAYSIEVEANAVAKATLVKGEAQAKVISLEAEALKANPDLIKLREVESWNGVMPSTILGGSRGMFLNLALDKK